MFDFTMHSKNSLTKQDRLCTYNGTMGRVLATIIVMEWNKYYIYIVFLYFYIFIYI